MLCPNFEECPTFSLSLAKDSLLRYTFCSLLKQYTFELTPRNMSPYREFKGWRVESEKSVTKFNHRHGFRAGQEDPGVTFVPRSEEERYLLIKCVLPHLNRQSVLSPFLSVYTSRPAAAREANRRIKCGESKVCIYEIRVPPAPPRSRDRIEYRWVSKLMRNLRKSIPCQAGRNANHEMLVLRKIPRDYVELIPKYEW